MLGVDIVNINRIKKIYNKFGNKFLEKVFTDKEIIYIEKKNYSIETISGLFAAKEALSKSMGTGISKLTFKNIEIFHDENKAPYGKVYNKIFDLSISHEREYAIAISNFREDLYKEDIDEFFKVLNRRDLNSHKGDFGKVSIIAGSKGMAGAGYLSSNAAMRTGTGLVYNIVPEDILDIMSIKYIEVIAKSFKNADSLGAFLTNMDAIGIGPGMGTGEKEKILLKEVLKLDKNIVIDADGITNISKTLDTLKTRKEYSTILTPHNGEFSRLCGLSVNEIENNRINIAKEFAQKYSCILLLKGNKTIVTDGKRVYLNRSGNPGMATAGSGDVLTGIIVSLLGRGIDTYKSACCGSYLHGRAGDLASKAVGEEALIASDIINNIYKVIDELYI